MTEMPKILVLTALLEETRAKAESFSHRYSKDRLLKIADEYERLARHAERWQTPETQVQAP